MTGYWVHESLYFPAFSNAHLRTCKHFLDFSELSIDLVLIVKSSELRLVL